MNNKTIRIQKPHSERNNTYGVCLDMRKWFLTCDAELKEETYDSMASFLLFETW